jgi:glutathione S-transferase
MPAMTAFTPPIRPIRLHAMAISGHSHRVQLFLSLLGLPCELRPVDVLRGEGRTPAFLALNPLGQVPVIEDGELVLADSNAILVYLARRYDASGRWLPGDPVGAARVQRWLSLAAGELKDGPASARFACLIGKTASASQLKVAQRLFAFMAQTLAAQPFLAAAEPTLADIAMYSYTAHAPEGGIVLEPFPNLLAWLARVEALPGFVPLVRSSLPAAA